MSDLRLNLDQTTARELLSLVDEFAEAYATKNARKYYTRNASSLDIRQADEDSQSARNELLKALGLA